MKSWPEATKEKSDYLLMRQNQNIERSKVNKAENWFNEKLKNSKYKFSRQRRWGYRIYDFWCHQLGLAIEIDGDSHSKGWDELRDKQDFERSRIIVIRVNNFNESEAYKALEYIHHSETWNQRRTAAGMKPITT
jgi:very-short-patch-repair endonuclease